MARGILTVKTLAEFDNGKAAAMFDRHVARVVQDCRDRPDDAKPRKVTLTAFFTPVPGESGDRLYVDYAAKSNFPEHRTSTNIVDTNNMNQLVFDDQTGDTRQRGLDQQGGFATADEEDSE